MSVREMIKHQCECEKPAGSIHSKCHKCKGRLPMLVRNPHTDRKDGWTGSKVRSKRYTRKS